MGTIPVEVLQQVPISKKNSSTLYYIRSHKLIEEMAELSEVLSHLIKGEPAFKKIRGEYIDVVRALKNYSPIANHIGKNSYKNLEKDIGIKVLPTKDRKKKIGLLTKASLNLISSMAVLQKEICKDMVGKTRSARLIEAYQDVWQDLLMFKNIVELKRKELNR